MNGFNLHKPSPYFHNALILESACVLVLIKRRKISSERRISVPYLRATNMRTHAPITSGVSVQVQGMNTVAEMNHEFRAMALTEKLKTGIQPPVLKQRKLQRL